MLAHTVLFTLRDRSAAARQDFLAACKQYLAGHEGTVFFAVGARAEEIQWSISDRDFDVALHVVFRDRAAHDRYQEDPRHLAFLQQYGERWEQIRVIDAYVELYECAES